MTVIVTKRLILTPASKDSFPRVVEWLNDRDIMMYSEQRHTKHSTESQEIYLEALNPLDRYMEIHSNGALIGTLSAHVDEFNDVADVGILIGERKARGKGFGTEAWQAFCDHLLDHGVRKIEAGCMGSNFGMLHIFRNTGMYYEGRRFAHFVVGDDAVDMVMYGKFR